jgi:hypothetical protein
MPYIAFDSYVVRIQGGTQIPANVFCYAGSGQVPVGVLVFVNDGDTKSPKQNTQTGTVTIYMLPSNLEPVLDTLRNEKPLKLYVSSTLSWGALVTGDKEPVGEHEP